MLRAHIHDHAFEGGSICTPVSFTSARPCNDENSDQHDKNSMQTVAPGRDVQQLKETYAHTHNEHCNFTEDHCAYLEDVHPGKDCIFHVLSKCVGVPLENEDQLRQQKETVSTKCNALMLRATGNTYEALHKVKSNLCKYEGNFLTICIYTQILNINMLLYTENGYVRINNNSHHTTEVYLQGSDTEKLAHLYLIHRNVPKINVYPIKLNNYCICEMSNECKNTYLWSKLRQQRIAKHEGEHSVANTLTIVNNLQRQMLGQPQLVDD